MSDTSVPSDDALAAKIQGLHRWPRAEYEHGKRYSVVRYQCGCHVLERHAMLTRGKEVVQPYVVLTELSLRRNFMCCPLCRASFLVPPPVHAK